MAEGKKSQVVLEWDHDTCTMQIGGNAANYDLAIAMCDTARRHFERLLNAAAGKAKIGIAPGGALEFLKDRLGRG